MKTKSPSNEYVLFFRDTQLAKRLSPEEMQALTLEWAAWVGRLRKQRKIKDGGPLEHEGTFISRKNAGLTSNIPLIASQETITAYSLIEANDLTEALEIAKDCPVLKGGSTIEIRPVAPRE